MQFTKAAPLLPWLPSLPHLTTDSCKPSGASLNKSGFIEELLVHCATAVDSRDSTLSHQLLWVLHNIAHPDGDSDHRLAAAFFRALVLRASPLASPFPLHFSPLSPVTFAAFLDITPEHRFGFAAANAAISAAARRFPVIHVVDLSTTHGMQLPTLIDSLASHCPENPPAFRVTVPSPSRSPLPTAVDIPVDKLGSRLVHFARSLQVQMEFHAVPSTPADGFLALIDHLQLQKLVADAAYEALVINCHMLLHYTPDETAANTAPSPRTSLLRALRELEPTVVVVVEEDADFVGGDVAGRLRAAFNYLWIPFDAADAFLARGSEERERYEAAVSWKIENVIAREGPERVERLEGRWRWVQRMRAAGFRAAGFGEEAAAEVKKMLGGHSAGWGMKRSEEELVLTWKGHDVVFASAWVPQHK